MEETLVIWPGGGLPPPPRPLSIFFSNSAPKMEDVAEARLLASRSIRFCSLPASIIRKL